LSPKRQEPRTVGDGSGTGAFSVSSSNVSTVIRYIDQQESHHKKKSFDDEFIAL
jgi:putative transposase